MKTTLLVIVGILIAMQFIIVSKTNPTINEDIKVNPPQEVLSILKASCYDCHSNETIWPAYSNIAPLSWSIVAHVNDGRDALNFSNWEDIDKKIKIKRLKRAIKTVNNGMMPLSSYLWLHDEAKLTNDQKNTLVEWFKSELKKLTSS